MFEPQNDLERSLMAATSDPAARPQFYRDLAASELFVIDDGSDLEQHQLRVRNVDWNGESYLPVFSSLPRLQAMIQEEVGYIALKAMDLMNITRGARLLLNPGSDYGKALLPEEIESILDGSIWQQETPVLLAQPANFPTELVEVLRSVFARHPGARKAYLAHFSNPAPHTLIAIDASEDWERIVTNVRIAAEGVEVPDPPIDFVRLAGSGLESYFQSIEPFYERKV